jgi:REP element-mobilizing transposase RayT
MPRKLRMEYPGAIYHIVNRGDRREDIFKDDLDRRQFISTLDEACQKTEWQVHAWCLMRNHFHLVIETPQANLVAGMKWLLGVYTKRFNIRHKFCGHVFAGRYKAMMVDGSGDGYLRTVCDYVHLNPAPPEPRIKPVFCGICAVASVWMLDGLKDGKPGASSRQSRASGKFDQLGGVELPTFADRFHVKIPSLYVTETKIRTAKKPFKIAAFMGVLP